MNQNNHFEMRYKKLTWEAILKSLFAGLTIAFSVNFVLGASLWIIGPDSPVLVIGLLFGPIIPVTGISGAAFYFAKFHPTAKSNARRIDSLGLEERAITMIDYKGDESLIANLQRSDAIKSLGTITNKDIRFNFSKKLIIPLVVSASLALIMDLLILLTFFGIIKSPSDYLQNSKTRPEYIPISYIVEEGGYIEGEAEQLVLFGENAEPVVAVAEEGYSFDGWDDGYRKPSRTDKKIDHPLVLTAIFIPLDEEGEDDGDTGESGENGEAPGEEEGDGDGDQQGDGQPGDNSGGSGGDPSTRDKNFIIDGTENNDYKLHLPKAKEDIMQYLKDNIDKLTEEERAIIEAYINIL